MHPAGVLETRVRYAPLSQQIFRIVIHAVFLQNPPQLLDERCLAMMCLLAGDVTPRRRTMRPTHGEDRVAFLPRESRLVSFRSPNRRSLLQLPDQFGWRVGGFQADQKMHMVLHAAHRFRYAAQTAHGAAEVFVERGPPFGADKRVAVLGTEDDVIMQAVKCGARGFLLDLDSGTPPGCMVSLSNVTGGLRGLRPPATVCQPFGLRATALLSPQTCVRCSVIE